MLSQAPHILSVISKFFNSHLPMEALSLQTLLRLHSSPRTIPSYVEKDQSKNNVARNLHERFHPPPAKTLRRRLFLRFMGFCPVLAHPVFAAPMPEIKEPEVIR